MVNNFTQYQQNKQSSPLNSDGQQFHQYEQNEQSHLILSHWTQKNITTYDVVNSGSALE